MKTTFTRLNTADLQKKRLTMIICEYKQVKTCSEGLKFSHFLAPMKMIAT